MSTFDWTTFISGTALGVSGAAWIAAGRVGSLSALVQRLQTALVEERTQSSTRRPYDLSLPDFDKDSKVSVRVEVRPDGTDLWSISMTPVPSSVVAPGFRTTRPPR